MLARACAAASVAVPAGAPINYNRDIRPLLAENCYACHGPDEAQRKAHLRLDVKEEAFKARKHGAAIVAGKAEGSSLIDRLTTTDEDDRMPPVDSGKHVTPAQIELIRKWIDQGANWQTLWSMTPPRRPELPEGGDARWCRNAIDRFIAARMEKEGLKPSPEADRAALLRRLKFDLIGLPPTPEELDSFLADNSADAFEKRVEAFLASPHYGERMAQEWLDAARYADTHGFSIDGGRDMTRWRDGVIDDLNHNKPFDQFTLEQLAGDLLPNATLEQKIASGFNRNHRTTFEGGTIPEEDRTLYVMDRVSTTGTVWLGLSVGCAQCHDHKYDPISQKDYYRLFAFFNNIPENGLDGIKGNTVPMVASPTPEQKQAIDGATAAIAELKKKIDGPRGGNVAEAEVAQAEWEKTAAVEKLAWVVPDIASMQAQGGTKLRQLEDKSILAEGANPAAQTYTISLSTTLPNVTAVRLEALPDEHLINQGPGRSENGNIVMTSFRLSAGAAATGAAAELPVKMKGAYADFSQENFPVASAIASKARAGWAIYPETGKPHEAVFEPEKPVKAAKLTVTMEFKSSFANHSLGRFRLSVTNAKDPRRDAQPPARILSILAVSPEKRTAQQKADVRAFYRTNVSLEFKAIVEQLAAAKKKLEALEETVPTTMVMQEMPQPRQAFVLLRGQYDQHGDPVSAAVPACLPPLPKEVKADRLALAKWLVAPNQPLTARVVVNRYWQIYFGTGIVKTSEDFGTQGEYPSHPELLDWLATEFVRTGWDIKAMQRLIVTSATYRQASRVSPELLARDPENRLLARGPRFRLPAEFVRDQALAISGLLNDQIGGAAVSPYQPGGLWEELSSRADGGRFTAQVFVQSHGRDLYRRSMYTFWKRNSPPPSLITFDAPDRQLCTVRRSRTNTPLQALVLMNDPTYVEASRKLAERMMGLDSPDGRIAFAFRLATAREPTATERGVLTKLFDAQLAAYRARPEDAVKLLGVGESKRDEKLDAAELAAYTMVANAILNLDETVTKQ